MNKRLIITVLIICLAACIILPGIWILRFLIDGTKIEVKDHIVGIIFTFLVTFSISMANLSTMVWMQRKYPWEKNIKKRIIYELLITTFNATILVTLLFVIINLIAGVDDSKMKQFGPALFSNILTAIIVNTIVMSIVEGIYLFRQWRISQVHVERLKRISVEAQLSVLKNQINPHFLFNSLNTLSSIIPRSPDKAVEFVSKFSKIFRYILDMREKTVIRLKEELAFIDSYYFLQKIRFGDALSLSVRVDVDKLDDLIPPLSIQILVENAIKHNESSMDHPLLIEVYNEGNFLIIKNKIRRKETDVQSTGLGLKNLAERYGHFTKLKPDFYIHNEEYIAKIPILKDDE